MGRYVTQNAPDSSKFNNCLLFSTTDKTECFIVPPGVCRIRVHVMGAGGTPCYAQCACSCVNNCVIINAMDQYGGAGGGYAVKTMSVTPGQVIPITVGSGGYAVFCQSNANCSAYGVGMCLTNSKGGTSSFGSILSATGGGVGSDIGCGVGGDINRCGGRGSKGYWFQASYTCWCCGQVGGGGSGGGWSGPGRNADGICWSEMSCCGPQYSKGADGTKVRFEMVGCNCNPCGYTGPIYWAWGKGGGAGTSSQAYELYGTGDATGGSQGTNSGVLGGYGCYWPIFGNNCCALGRGFMPHVDDIGRESGGAGGGGPSCCSTPFYSLLHGACGSGAGSPMVCRTACCGNEAAGIFRTYCSFKQAPEYCLCNFPGIMFGTACRAAVDQQSYWTNAYIYACGRAGLGGNGTVLVEW